MHALVTRASPSSEGRWALRVEGAPDLDSLAAGELAAAVGRLAAERPRWVWASTAGVYPLLLRAGVRVERGHDVALTEALLRGHEERPGTGEWLEPGTAPGGPSGQATLFGDEPLMADDGSSPPGAGSGAGQLDRLEQALADQRGRMAAARSLSPGFPLLVAAESAAALAAAEMGHVGLPWRADVHDEVLTDLLGERPRHGGRPPTLRALAVEVTAALDAPALNPDSPVELLRAFRRQGVLLASTRAWELKRIDHPAVAPLLRYKELARLHVAHGWAWRDQWVHAGRFRPEYIPGGVVSGRWATRGGGALQIPKAMRAAVVADPGWVLVVADAGQVEPRLLAALADDPGMIAATQAGDLYADIAARALGKPEARPEAKLALLSAMYGGGANSPALAALRRRFPRAFDLLEVAARAGEDGGVVRSVLGRTSPPPGPGWQDGPDAVVLARARARGRFTRNFVVQASAADWANALVAGLRQRLAALPVGDGRADLVFFQHDEVIVHAPARLADAAIAAITESGDEATRLVVGDKGVRVPLRGVRVASYADKA